MRQAAKAGPKKAKCAPNVCLSSLSLILDFSQGKAVHNRSLRDHMTDVLRDSVNVEHGFDLGWFDFFFYVCF